MGFRKADQTAENLPRSLPGSVQVDLWCQAPAGFHRDREAVWFQHYHEIPTWSEGMQHLNELSSVIWILNCFAIQKMSVSMQSAVQWPVLNYKVCKLPKKHHICRRQEGGNIIVLITFCQHCNRLWTRLCLAPTHSLTLLHISFQLIQGTVRWWELWDKLQHKNRNQVNTSKLKLKELCLPSSGGISVAVCSLWEKPSHAQSACCCKDCPATGHFRSQPQGLQDSPAAGAFWWRQCLQEEILVNLAGVFHGSLFSWQNLHSEICGKRDKVEELLKHADQCSAAIKVLRSQHFCGCGFSWSGTSHCLCSADGWKVSSLMCVQKLLGWSILGTKHNESNLCTCHLKTVGSSSRHKWELLLWIKASF